MKIYPIAFDSLGVRSMCTLVCINNLKIIIDPYAALAPKRFGLEPSNLEIDMLNFYLKQIYKIGNFCNYAIVTHYHYDHHPRPNDTNFFESFRNCKFLIKKFEKEHYSARKRGKLFEENLKKFKIEYEFADNEEIKIGRTKIIFSEPVWHGEVNSKVGRVITLLLKYKKEKFFFGSDAQFLIDENALNFVLDHKPKYLIIDGFPTILEGYKVKKESFKIGVKHMEKIFEEINYEWIIIDHHLLRDKNFDKKFPYFDYKKITTAAKYYNLENLLLEAYRKEIFENKISFDLNKYKSHFSNLIKNVLS
ncbi:MAG: MBL fold metallo-hydrolase [Candidatus Aenigmatarchaeota archaeon]